MREIAEKRQTAQAAPPVDRIGPYRVLVDSRVEPKAIAGTIVYRPNGYDYGCANDDTRITGIEHISVTLSENGDYPLFTIPRLDLEMYATRSPSTNEGE